MEDGTIQDSDITASSANDVNYGPEKARLHMEEKRGDASYKAGWRAKTNDDRQWIEINLKQVMKVTKIATQGGYFYHDYRYHYRWVTSYSLSYRVEDQCVFHDHQNNKVRNWTFTTKCK